MKTKLKSNETKSIPPPLVKQPPHAYPRFLFRFVFKKGNKKVRKYAAAYSTRLAIAQAKNLAYILNLEFVRVIKKERMDWSGYSERLAPWKNSASRAKVKPK